MAHELRIGYAVAPTLWGAFIGLGLSSGANSIVAAALWVELFEVARMGPVRGVYAALAVLTTALSPVLLGHARQEEFPLPVIAITVALYVAAVPLVVRLRPVPAVRLGG